MTLTLDIMSSYPHRMSDPAPLPPLKWAGGKRALAATIHQHAPKSFGTYYEPFLGGGAVFFRLQPERAVLGDLNRELVTTLYALAFAVDKVIGLLETHVRLHGREYYLLTRETDPDKLPPYEAAARMLYLNRAGWHGLYRVSRKGKFNVPFGDGAPVVFDHENLRRCSKALRKAQNLVSSHYMTTLRDVVRGDFVYLDPPYAPTSKTAGFSAFTKDAFGDAEQGALADHFRHMVAEGVHCIASNADTPRVRELYRGFRLVEVTRRGTMNSDPAKRGRVGELLILGDTW